MLNTIITLVLIVVGLMIAGNVGASISDIADNSGITTFASK